MSLLGFNGWIEQRRIIEEYADNPLLDMKQQEGDKVYFGIHDLDRYYKDHGTIPELEFADIMDKAGEVGDTDPVNSTVLVTVSKDPFHFGYHNLETKAQRNRRKQKGEGRIDIKVPIDCLIDVSHLIEGEHRVWLVVDQKTKYQAGLMKQIRKREMRAYMDKETNSSTYEIDDSGADLDLSVEPKYKFVNREVEPVYQFKAHYDPTLSRFEKDWKHHLDKHKFDYYPE